MSRFEIVDEWLRGTLDECGLTVEEAQVVVDGLVPRINIADLLAGERKISVGEMHSLSFALSCAGRLKKYLQDRDGQD